MPRKAFGSLLYYSGGTLNGQPAQAGLTGLCWGWNDMGAADSVPPVLVQRDLLAAQIGRPAAVAEVSLAAAQRIQRETPTEGQTALALRIDADRHLRLRLASAITDRSAQDLLTDALDALLVAVPEVDTLVAQLSRARTRP